MNKEFLDNLEMIIGWWKASNDLSSPTAIDDALEHMGDIPDKVANAICTLRLHAIGKVSSPPPPPPPPPKRTIQEDVSWLRPKQVDYDVARVLEDNFQDLVGS